MFGMRGIDPVVAATIWRQRVFLTETAGLFWILAEVGVLYAMLVVRRHLEARPLSDRLCLTVREKRRVAVWLGVFAVVAAAILGRLLVAPDLAAQIRSGAPIGDLEELFRSQTYTHMVLWATFTGAWVVLEAMIVYQGWRGYRAFRRLLSHDGRTRSGTLSAILLLAVALLIGLAGKAVADPVADALREVHLSNEVYRNALHLYVRLAGVVWIAVEWVAAILLWRSCSVLAAAAKRKAAR